MRSLADLTIRQKLWVGGAAALAAMVAIAGFMIASYRSILLEQKQLATRHVVETAAGVLEHYAGLARQGALTEAEAKRAAIAAVKGLRYEQTEYFWINDLRPAMVMHPYKPELDGKDLSEVKDPEGKRLFVEFVDTVKRARA